MRKNILCIPILGILALSSCKKNVPPANTIPVPTTDIHNLDIVLTGTGIYDNPYCLSMAKDGTSYEYTQILDSNNVLKSETRSYILDTVRYEDVYDANFILQCQKVYLNANTVSTYLYEAKYYSYEDDSVEEKIYSDDSKENLLGKKEYIIKNNRIESKITYSYSYFMYKKEYKYLYSYSDQGQLLSFEEYRSQDNVWYGLNKKSYCYDENSFCTETIEYIWNHQKLEFIPNIKLEKVNDVNNHYTSDASYIWDNSNTRWIGSRKSETQSNDQGKPLQESTYVWKNSHWYGDSQTGYKYNKKGNLVQQLSYEWNSIKDDWEFSTRRDYQYDKYGNITLDVSLTWDSSNEAWMNNEKTVRTYLAKDKILSVITYRGLTDGDWIMDSKDEYEYDDRGNETVYNQFTYDMYPNLLSGSKRNRKYDDKNRVTYYETYSYDYYTKEFYGKEKYEATYTEDDSILSKIQYTWDSTSKAFVLYIKITNAYDSKNRISSSITQKYTDKKVWVNVEKIEYSYSKNNVSQVVYHWDESTETWV